MRRSDAIVASMAGRGPPYQAEMATAGTKNKKLGAGPSRRRISVATSAIAVTISVRAYRASDVRRFSDRWLDPNNVRPGNHDSDLRFAWRSDFNSEYVAAEGSVDGASKQSARLIRRCECMCADFAYGRGDHRNPRING